MDPLLNEVIDITDVYALVYLLGPDRCFGVKDSPRTTMHAQLLVADFDWLLLPISLSRAYHRLVGRRRTVDHVHG
jgi:hypothetical protein